MRISALPGAFFLFSFVSNSWDRVRVGDDCVPCNHGRNSHNKRWGEHHSNQARQISENLPGSRFIQDPNNEKIAHSRLPLGYSGAAEIAIRSLECLAGHVSY